MPELETVDLIGVEILATGGPVRGVGSPPEGDFWTTDDLRAMAAADLELGAELKPPNKIGHSDLQALVTNTTGLPVSAGEMPAVGWLENLRVNDAGDKLLADIMAVPKKLAELLEAGAWRTRSVELSKVESQVTGKVYDWVVTGLVWLGGKMPAVRTLDDVYALYEQEGVTLAYQDGGAVELRWIVSYAVGDVVWSPDDGFYALRGLLHDALNGPDEPTVDARFWVRDIMDGKALVCDYYETEETAWIVPFTITSTGAELASRAAWTPAQMAWVERAKEYEERLNQAETAPHGRRSDSRPVSVTYTVEQRRKFAEATGLEADKVTDEMLAASGVAVEGPKADDELARELEADERLRKFEEKLEASDARSRKLEEELSEERRRNFVEGVLKDGKAEPGQRETVEALYDASPEAARKHFEGVKPNVELGREYGSDADADAGDVDDETHERNYAADASRRFGVSAEEVV